MVADGGVFQEDAELGAAGRPNPFPEGEVSPKPTGEGCGVDPLPQRRGSGRSSGRSAATFSLWQMGRSVAPSYLLGSA